MLKSPSYTLAATRQYFLLSKEELSFHLSKSLNPAESNSMNGDSNCICIAITIFSGLNTFCKNKGKSNHCNRKPKDFRHFSLSASDRFSHRKFPTL